MGLYFLLLGYFRSRDSSVSIATGYGLVGRGSIANRGKKYLFSIASTPALGPTQPIIQWAPAALSQGVKRGSVSLTTHLNLAARWRIRWLVAGFQRGGPCSIPTRVRSGHVVEKVALGPVFSKYFGFPCQFSFHQMLHTRLSSGADTVGQIVADVPSGLSLTPPQEIKKTCRNGHSRKDDISWWINSPPLKDLEDIIT
jgi:hypothetical protein